MPEIRKLIIEYDKLIIQAESLKEKIIIFREGFPGRSHKQTKTLQLLESASDHIVDNLKRIKQRALTDIEEG